MNKKFLLMVLGSVLLAVIVAMMVNSAISSKSKQASQLTDVVEILVAKQPLFKGDTLKQQDVAWKQFPTADLFNGVVKKKEQKDENKLEVYNKMLRRDIEVGEPITTQSLVMDVSSASNNLSVKLEPNMRAVAISVKAETTAGGFIAPGDKVDVLLTYQVKLKGEAASYSEEAVQQFATETILTNVRVLAVDQNDKDKSFAAKVAKTVTLEVTAEGAQKLSLAGNMGRLSLSLRRLGEKDTKADANIPVSTDVKDSKMIKKIYSNMDKRKSRSNTVRVYSGTDVVDVPLGSGEKK